MQRSYAFIVNPASGAGSGRIVGRLLADLAPDYPEFAEARIFSTEDLRADTLQQLLSTTNVVVVGGGDGSVNYLLPHLLRHDPPPILGVIPLGTSNDLARTLGVSPHVDYSDRQVLRDTLEKILGAQTVSLDVLRLNESVLFCNYLSAGLDAAIVWDFDHLRSRWNRFVPPARMTNNLLYFLMGLKNATSRLKPPIELSYESPVGGGNLAVAKGCRCVIVSNLPLYAGGCPLYPEARADDGLFEATIVDSLYQFVALIAARFLPFLRLPKTIRQFQVSAIRICLSSPYPFQIDGERGSEKRSEFRVSRYASLRTLRF